MSRLDWYVLSGLAVSALIGVIAGRARGRPGWGAVFGLLLGPIGWLIVLAGPDRRPKCPECLGVTVPGARKCKNCGSSLGLVAGATAAMTPSALQERARHDIRERELRNKYGG